MSGPLYESAQVCEIAGITYRQLDHWIRCDYVTPGRHLPGSGAHRGFTEDEVRHITVMGRAVLVGLAPKVAAGLASRACHAYRMGAQRANLGLGNGSYFAVDVPEIPPPR